MVRTIRAAGLDSGMCSPASSVRSEAVTSDHNFRLMNQSGRPNCNVPVSPSLEMQTCNLPTSAPVLQYVPCGLRISSCIRCAARSRPLEENDR